MADTPLQSIETDSPDALDTIYQMSVGSPINAAMTGFKDETAPSNEATFDQPVDTNDSNLDKSRQIMEQPSEVSNQVVSERGVAMDAFSSSSLPLQTPSPLPKKRGRPRKQSLPGTTSKVSNGQVVVATPPRKRGRPPKSASKKTKSPTLNMPTSEDRRSIPSIHRSNRAKDKLPKKLFDSSNYQKVPQTTTATTTTTTTKNGMSEDLGSGMGMMTSSTPFPAPAGYGSMAPTGFDIPYSGRKYSTGKNAVNGFQSMTSDTVIMAPSPLQCPSCNMVKGIIQDILFQHSVQEQDVWVIPQLAAVELHRYFGGGTPFPQKDVLIPAEKVEMIRHLIFESGK
ncbi:hypothetical protein PFICI_15244 [Pestalotiopsis fici W106-1]|uniref:Uncharacterized protein n=1 Tax=Pestalotiopsis fici (strain W106-1 / CGMCC3.15140) TaxID=1229662 RepID=W3WGZ6_PESFW|nr:uncharacterized protein PFICI_15244 [Pestalotiopsis fici W106-1]ETS73069.1 hypothetical protein PFICI_15244 [Pestalotiopsis fici W106-1]